ncbi:hypothetical protein [Sporosarcina cascadiensis]|uniref:hypothetical protein n=1 Tax=Sporosarcina cascadiensis TaxID=2660747 RepID=UPI00129A40F6|nr:hypothetical protein [Sporosarcina cascadiensis]
MNGFRSVSFRFGALQADFRSLSHVFGAVEVVFRSVIAYFGAAARNVRAKKQPDII